MATIDQVRDAMHHAPFTSFTVRLVDGRSFVVHHPDFCSVSPHPQGRGVTIHDKQGMHSLDTRIVEAIEPVQSEASSTET